MFPYRREVQSWRVAAQVSGLPAWAIHHRLETAQTTGGLGSIWDGFKVSDPSSIASTFVDDEDPPGIYLSEKIRERILDSFHINVFTLLKPGQVKGAARRGRRAAKKRRLNTIRWLGIRCT